MPAPARKIAPDMLVPDPQIAPDPFDPASLRLDPGADLVPVKRVITRVAVHKPHRQDFVRVHPDPDWQLDTRLLKLNEERDEMYLVAKGMWAELGDEAKSYRLYTTANRGGAVFLWPVALPGPDGKENSWPASAHQAAKEATRAWTQVASNRALGEYTCEVAEVALGEPQWPDLTFTELLKIAFRDRYINSVDHPVVRRLRGRA